MADKQIGSAVQEGRNKVVAYDEKGSKLFSKSGELAGYTASTVSVKEGSRIVTYDSKGSKLFSK